MFGMTAKEFVLLNNTDRDALREPWRVRPLFARCALELQENDKVGVTVFGLGKLPYTYLAPYFLLLRTGQDRLALGRASRGRTGGAMRRMTHSVTRPVCHTLHVDTRVR